MRRARQTTEGYRVAKKARQTTQKFRFAKRAREKTEEYKAKKRVRENAPKAKLSRQQRKWARFWSPCFFNWNLMKSKQDYREANNAAPYAPRFRSDGRLSILQHGVVRYLPCPDEPPLPVAFEGSEDTGEEEAETETENKSDTEHAEDDEVDCKEGQQVERLVWRVVTPSFTVHVSDKTGGLSGDSLVISSIREMFPEAAYYYQVQKRISANKHAAPVLDRAREARGDGDAFDHGAQVRTAAQIETTSIKECAAPALGRASREMEDVEDGTQVRVASSDECSVESAAEQHAEHQSPTMQIEEFHLALALQCRVGSINCARALKSTSDPGHCCCAKWTRTEIHKWREIQKRWGAGWRSSRAFYQWLKTQEELELSERPLDKDRLRLGIFRKSGHYGCDSYLFDPAGRPPWFIDPKVEPKPPRTGCAHAKRLKTSEWHCPMAQYARSEIIEASVRFATKICNRVQVGRIREDFCNPPREIRDFLCNSLCPWECCTLKCPWNSNGLAGSGEPLALHACSCGWKACHQCWREAPLRETTDFACQTHQLLGVLSSQVRLSQSLTALRQHMRQPYTR